MLVGAVLRHRRCPILVLRILRGRRHKAFGAQFPDALDMIVRSLRAGHPVPIAITMVAREMRDPIGSEFGIVADEITYGADLETALRNLYFRIGQDDLPLFVTAVGDPGIDRRQSRRDPGQPVQASSASASRCGARSARWRRKAAPPRSSSPRCRSLMFLIIQIVAPDFYAGVWNEDMTKKALLVAGTWMGSATSSCTGW